ncbi:hypothetical protein BJ875DRAFT_53864 [Amylocarpus encephaloides]|uniref:Uncharacterized protein n=1 Tax=Amylocarpus encephaloides TaxID=45428 RepID=A0A9P8C416_9HELO|nr:hypothetical protein BJ875DRAFT_53864 [Amylocarpus encephaloides]
MMRDILRIWVLAAVGLAGIVQAENHLHANSHEATDGLSDLLDALGALGGAGGKGQGEAAKGNGAKGVKEPAAEEPKTMTVTVASAAAAQGRKNETCAAASEKTTTVTHQVAAAAGTGNAGAVQLSFLSSTVFGTGPPTVTITPLPQMVTQMITITVSNGGASGVNPPEGAKGTGHAGGGAKESGKGEGTPAVANPPEGAKGSGNAEGGARSPKETPAGVNPPAGVVTNGSGNLAAGIAPATGAPINRATLTSAAIQKTGAPNAAAPAPKPLLPQHHPLDLQEHLQAELESLTQTDLAIANACVALDHSAPCPQLRPL